MSNTAVENTVPDVKTEKVKKTIKVPKGVAEAVAGKEKRTKRRYLCYVPRGVNYNSAADTKENRKVMNAEIKRVLEKGDVEVQGYCSGSSPSLAAAKKAKLAAACNSNIVIIRQIGQFKLFFVYFCQRVRTKELEYKTNEAGQKIAAIDKATGQEVPPITRRIKTGEDDPAAMTTSMYWSEWENKVTSLHRVKFTNKPKHLPSPVHPSGEPAEEEENPEADIAGSDSAEGSQ